MGQPLRILVDHISGSRRGQRQELVPAERITFGRHPDNQVTFDAHRDLDASSRHAELRRDDARFTLIDIGSSNGTFVAGERITEVEVEIGVPLEIEFGTGGPMLRLFIGDDEQVAELPGIELGDAPEPARRGRRWILAIVLILAVAAVIALMWWRQAA